MSRVVLDWDVLEAIYRLSHKDGNKGHFPGDDAYGKTCGWVAHEHVVAVVIE